MTDKAPTPRRMSVTVEELDILIGLAAQSAVIEARAEYERTAKQHRAYSNRVNFFFGIIVGGTGLWGAILLTKLIITLVF